MSDSDLLMKCPVCGAINRHGADTRCWVCEQPFDADKAVWLQFYDDEQVPQPARGTSFGGLILVALVLFLGAGLFMAEPGFGILFLICSVIPLIRTLMLVDPAKSPGQATSLFFTSLFVTFTILAVLSVVAFGSFCLTLFGVCAIGGAGGGPGAELGLLVLWGVPLAAVGLCAIPLWRWVAHRWARDKADSERRS
jgi:hypothetical protein